jgi:hypothetical protein
MEVTSIADGESRERGVQAESNPPNITISKLVSLEHGDGIAKVVGDFLPNSDDHKMRRHSPLIHQAWGCPLDANK